MTLDELRDVLGWARAEGWNPGFADAEAFHATDPEGFLLAEIDGAPAAAISVVRHAPDVGFLGLYICRPEHRGRGVGFGLWKAGMARLEGVRVGLDGVVAQQDNYRRSGFALSHRNLRFTGRLAGAPCAEARPIDDALRAAILARDAEVAGYARPAFLHAWMAPCATRHALALVRDGALRGYGAIRACVEGSKIGPLFAESRAEAEALLGALAALAPEGPVALDLPEPNAEAVAMVEALGMAPAFETARMWRGPAPAEDLRRVFGVATFELG